MTRSVAQSSLRPVLFATAATLAVTILPARPAAAQTAADLVGVWTLVDLYVEQGDKKILPYGSNPRGTQISGRGGASTSPEVIERKPLASPSSSRSRSSNRSTSLWFNHTTSASVIGHHSI